MDLSRYRCPKCEQTQWQTTNRSWICKACGQTYSCTSGIPRLYLESKVGPKDKELRDYFYDGLLGTYYQYVMPFLTLPVRPAKAFWKGWGVYALVVLGLATLVGY